MSVNEKFTYPGKLIVGAGAITGLREVLSDFGSERIFLLADKNTYSAAGERAEQIARAFGAKCTTYVYPESPAPDDRAVGTAFMHCPSDVDTVIGVGSGVINDIGKLVSSKMGKKYAIVATAASMDGYASATSSMCRCGCKVSIPTKLPDAIVGDTDIISKAPSGMLLSGFGDMLAKYVSICEWRISNLINGEEYSEQISQFVREMLADGSRAVEEKGLSSPDTARIVFEGLIGTGVAMYYAGCSRPASGCEHYISHVYDMRSEALGTPSNTHGIQCAVATLVCVKLYEELKKQTPDRERAVAFVKSFDKERWFEILRELVGRESALVMEELEEKEGKYDVEKHSERVDVIIENFDKILAIASEELPSYDSLFELYTKIGMPRSFAEAEMEEELLPRAIAASRDIRYKYVLSHLLFDLGLNNLYEE